MNLLFWNVNGNDVAGHLLRCLDEHGVDIALLSEANAVDFDSLLIRCGGKYRLVFGVIGACDKIWMLAKNSVSVSVHREQARFALYEVAVNHERFLIAGTHLQDRFHCDTSIRLCVIREMMRDAWDLASGLELENLIVIGDLNANPYDRELVQPDAFNGILFKDVIRQSSFGTFGGKPYPRLYNPTVHFLSEESKMYGSFYRLSSTEPNPVWNCLDQALVSAALADRVAEYRYLRSIDGMSLMNDVRPNSTISDHLPLLVTLS